MIQRKLGNDQLREFFKLMNIGWHVLAWHMKGGYWTNNKGMNFRPVYEHGLITPDDEQAYIIIDLSRPLQNVKSDILYHFHLTEHEVFEKQPSPAYDYMYGMTFTFRPDIENEILRMLTEKAGNRQ
jgi:hypothetical protein